MATSPYELKILECDETLNTQTKNILKNIEIWMVL